MFPIRLAPVEPPPRRSDFGHPSVFKRMLARWHRARLCRRAVHVLNLCASGEVCRSGGRPSAAILAPSSARLSSIQQSVLERVVRRVARFGPPPASTPDQAVNELLGTSSAEEPRPSTLVLFEWSRLKLLQDDWAVQPQELADIAPPCVADAFRDPECFRLSEEQVELIYGDEPLVRPYWDPRLRGDAGLRRKFFRALHQR